MNGRVAVTERTEVSEVDGFQSSQEQRHVSLSILPIHFIRSTHSVAITRPGVATAMMDVIPSAAKRSREIHSK
jgi:hypothetical protein